MKLNPLQFEVLLNTIARAWCLNKKNMMQFKYFGIDPKSWPSCKAKALLLEFEFLLTKHDHSWASSMLGSKICDLEHLGVLPDLNNLRVQYDSNLTSARAKELAMQIMNEPDRVDEFINSFVTNKQTGVDLKVLSERIHHLVEKNEKLIAAGKSKIVYPDFKILSNKIGGFNPGRVTIISAKSGFGKTKLAINLALSASKIMPVLFFNMEMTELDFAASFLHRECQISNSDWASGAYITETNQKKILDFANNQSNQNILYTTGKGMTIDAIESTILSQFTDSELNTVIVDYDQKIITQNDDEWMAVLRAVERLEDCSKKTNSHIIMLAQASDEGHIKSSKRASQPASCVLNFDKDGGAYILEAKKNRFGQNGFKLQMLVDHATSTIKEHEIITAPVDNGIKTKYERFIRGDHD